MECGKFWDPYGPLLDRRLGILRHEIVEHGQRLIELLRIASAGLGEVGAAAAMSPNHLCDLADQAARVKAVEPEKYRAWLTQQAADIKESQALLALTRKTRGAAGP